MKQVFIFLVFACCAWQSYGQADPRLRNQIISIHATHRSADQILSDLGKKLGYSISYNAGFLKTDDITLSYDSLSLGQLIDSVFTKKDLQLRLIGDHQLVVYESIEALTSPPDTCYQIVEGRLIDNFTETGLARASIRELQTNQLTVSNGEGIFLLKTPCNLKTAQLEISAMGYRSQFINHPLDAEIGTIVMEGDYIALQEVYILSVHADLLMEEVLNGICDNYMDRPTRSTSFFREAILKNGNMVALSEAVFDVYNHPYGSVSGKKDQVQLVKGRKFTDHVNLDTLVFKIKGSLRSCFELDVVKNQPYFFSPDAYKNTYIYSFNTIMEYNGRDMYVIDFRHRPMTDGMPYEGKMYIDRERKTLVFIEFELSKRSIKNTENYFVLKKTRSIKAKLLNAQYRVHYTDVNGRLAMNYASFTSEFRVRKKNSLFAAKYETITEYVVNKFEWKNVGRIKPRDSFEAETIFLDEPLEYMDSYWEGINYLPIDKPLLESSEELQKVFAGK